MAAEGREKLTRKWKLHVYHRLPRLRLAITKSDLDEAFRYGEERGWNIESIKLWDRYIVYPRFRRFKDGRIILPAFFVEYNRLRPDGIYTFTITYLLVPPPPPLPLYRVKIRLYNEMEGPNGSPTGMFQAWFDIDATLDPSTRLVRWDWWLTALEVRIAKTHMVGYFKGMAKWAVPEGMGQAYLDETLGIPYGVERATYARKLDGSTYTKRIPQEYIAKAEQMTVEELVVGESSVEPKPNPKPTAENMGVFFEKVMIIGPDGTIKWQEVRDRWIWHPTDDQVKKVKEELGIA